MTKTSNTFEIDNLTGKNHDGAHPNMPLKFLTASSIIGDEVLNKGGGKLGKINDIMLNLSKGKIEYVVIEMGGFLGIGEKYFAVPFALLEVDAKKEVFILDQTKEALQAAPGFDKDHWPQTNSHEFDNSSTYWGGFMGVNTGGVPY
jgi:sporulation protein YlmC with PRC-barrel domain